MEPNKAQTSETFEQLARKYPHLFKLENGKFQLINSYTNDLITEIDSSDDLDITDIEFILNEIGYDLHFVHVENYLAMAVSRYDAVQNIASTFAPSELIAARWLLQMVAAAQTPAEQLLLYIETHQPNPNVA